MKETPLEVHGPIIFEHLGPIIIILKEKDGSRSCVMNIGPSEAYAIALYLRDIEASRPLTHDLIKNILKEFGILIRKIVVTKLVDTTFYASIFTEDLCGNIREIDSRPSDAIGLALRSKSPLYINDELLAEDNNLNEKMSDEETKKWLENLDPEKMPKA